MNLFSKIASSLLIATFIFTSSGFFEVMTINRANAQQQNNIVDFVVDGQPVLDGCQGVTGAKYASIAAELGIDVGGGIRGGLSAIGDELSGSAGDALLGGLKGIGSALADSAIGEAVGSLGSSIGDALGGIAGGALSAALPGIGSVLGGVVGGLFGGGGPDPVVEEGLRGLQQQAQKLSAYASQTVSEKERCLDALSRKAGEQSLRDLTAQSVDWVQNEFELYGRSGQSGFVQNLNQYLTNVAQGEFDQYISSAVREDGPFSRVCNFLRQPVGESVTNEFLSNSDPAGQDDFDGTELGEIPDDASGAGCELVEGVTEEEAQNFLEGDFSAGGGWEGLARSAGNPGMSPVTAYLQQRSQLNERINEAEEREQEELRWGQGFIADRSEQGFTPGSVVQGIIERISTSDISRLELVDEMGEVAGNIGNTLIGKIAGGGSGLDTAAGNETVGGSGATSFDYLANSLTERIQDQLITEREISDVINQVVPLYDDERVDDLISGARSCLADGNLSARADDLYASTEGNLDTFRSTVLQTQTKVDWRGEPFPWVGVIEESTRRPIGWNGTDYNWADDDVDRYYKQGTEQGCEDEEDENNVSYVVRQAVVVDSNFHFGGLFADAEPDVTDRDEILSFIRDDHDGTVDDPNHVYIDGKHYVNFRPKTWFEDGGIYTVWEKQICQSEHWRERLDWNSPGRGDFPESPEGERRFQNTRCELTSVQNYQYCITPAYRAPQFIAGEMYRQNNDGEVEESQCQSAVDAGTHYFVYNEDSTWSTRECRRRQSPEGSAVEWEPGFPDSAGNTSAEVYQEGVTETPILDQIELIEELEEMIVDLDESNTERDVLEVQEEFYGMREQFNDADAADAIAREARSFVRNIRSLNELALESQDQNAGEEGFSGCSGIQELNSFGSEFLNDNPEGGDGEGEGGEPNPPVINNLRTRGTTDMLVTWDASADSCEASSNPASNWNGPVPTSGTINVGNIPESGVNAILTCERGGETTSENVYFLPSDDRDGRIDSPRGGDRGEVDQL